MNVLYDYINLYPQKNLDIDHVINHLRLQFNVIEISERGKKISLFLQILIIKYVFICTILVQFHKI